MNKLLLWVGAVALAGCGGESPYRDTTELEVPPAVEIEQLATTTSPQIAQRAKPEKVVVVLDDSQTPPLLKIRKFQDRAWELVLEALNDKQIEIVDKNREAGIVQVKYDASEDSGESFGNVRFFWFEDEYGEAKYEIKLDWNGLETDVKVRLLQQAESTDEDDELADGSEKLVKLLYKTIKAIVDPEEKEQ